MTVDGRQRSGLSWTGKKTHHGQCAYVTRASTILYQPTRVDVTETERHQHHGAPLRAAEKVRLLSADGLRWTVREVPAPPFDRRGGTHLVFDGELVMRRLRSFPANWYDLSDDVLYALSDKIPP